MLYIKSGVQRNTDKPVRVSYRFGETIVTGDIEDLCTYMTAIDVLNAYDKKVSYTDDGGSSTSSKGERISNYKAEIKELYNSLMPISTL